MKSDIMLGERMLLSYIKCIPGVHMGSKSLVYLEHYIHGYDNAMFFHGIKQQSIIPAGMQEFIEKKYGIFNQTSKNYFGIIIDHSIDEKQAFDTFFELLDEYLLSIHYEPLPLWDNTDESKKLLLNLLSKSI